MQAEDVQLCPKILLTHPLDPPLTATEKILVCGVSKSRDQSHTAWQDIPFSQARFHLRTFLQARGYLHPQFEQLDSGSMKVVLGNKTLVTTLQAEGAPPSLRLDRKRRIIGRTLTPDLLTELEQWTLQKLQTLGHACPKVVSQADSTSGTVTLKIDPGERQFFAAIHETPIPNTSPNILRRYDAFQLGGLYNGDLLTVSEKRILSERIVQNAHFITNCDAARAIIQQRTTPGATRFLNFGFGTNTEGLLLGKLSFRNTRLGDKGSLFDTTALVSTRNQRIDVSLNWYHLPYPSRQYLNPLISFRHEDETYFKQVTARTQLAYATTWDGSKLGLKFDMGPSYEILKTLEGSGPRDSQFLSFETEFSILSHRFEYYAASPRTGFSLSAHTAMGSKKLYSDISAQRIRLSWENLWNYRDYDPPLWVIGVRGALATTFTGERPGPQTGLPPTFRQYLGGAADLRGFGRNELPRSGEGGLTSLFLDLEFRFTDLIPYGIQPLLFVDLGAISPKPLSLQKPLYGSPGVGFRWESAIGVIRGTASHGFLIHNTSENPDASHWQFYLSYGEEF